MEGFTWFLRHLGSRELELKNRWIMLAMHTGFATGNALTERDYAFYEVRARVARRQ